jgi:type 2 lantibiotic biosynthesis protein LanM
MTLPIQLPQGIEARPAQVWKWPDIDQKGLIETHYDGDVTRYRRRVLWGQSLDNESIHPFPEGEISQWKVWFAQLDWTACLSRDDKAYMGEAAFAPLLRPLLFRTRLDVAPIFDELAPGVSCSLLAALEERMLGIGHRALYSEFDRWRMTRNETDFGEFLDYWVGGQGEKFFVVDKPFLGCWMHLVCAQWVNLVQNLFRRLDEDSLILQGKFGFSVSTAAITGIDGLESDAHDGGAMVVVLHFTCGESLVYKPRGVKMELAIAEYARVLSGLDERLSLPTTKVVQGSRGGHGWSRFVVSPDIWTVDALDYYYRRAGRLLFHSALLGTRDLHMENVLASVDGPVIIDAECLLQPRQDGLGTGAGTMARAVRDTGLLAEQVAGQDIEAAEIGGYTGEGGHLLPLPGVEYEHVHTIDMRPVEVPRFSSVLGNLPRTGLDIHRLRDHADAVCEGFESAWLAATEHGDGVASALSVFDGVETRFISRPTNQYGMVLLAMIQPDALSCPKCQAAALEQLLSGAFKANSLPPSDKLIRAEMNSLLQLDVPVFHVSVDAVDLKCGDEVCVEGAFLTSGVRAAGERLRALDQPGLENCIRAIRKLTANEKAEVQFAEVNIVRDKTKDALMTDVEGLANRVLACLEHCEDKSLSDRTGEPDLYDGEPGAALFLSAFGKCTSNTMFVERGAELMERASKREQQSVVGLGAVTGKGSLALSMASISRISGDRRWLENAIEIVSRVSVPTLMGEKEKDLLAGLAGWVAVISEMMRVYPETVNRLRAPLKEAVNALLESSENGPNGMKQWRGADGLAMYGGLAHGVSGVALALARAANVLKDPALSEMALEALAAEDRAYDPELSNWMFQIDSLGQRKGMNAWCNGASGIGLVLSEVRATGVWSTELKQMLSRVSEKVKEMSFTPIDHCCCGNAGRLGISHTLALREDEVSIKFVRQAESMFLEHRRREGRFNLDEEVEGWLGEAGFFRGLSGIGYVLLRLREPSLLPDILALRCAP